MIGCLKHFRNKKIYVQWNYFGLKKKIKLKLFYSLYINMRKVIKIIAGAFAGLFISSCSNLMKPLLKNYKDPYHKKVEKGGFVEKSLNIENTKLFYVEGPNNGPVLLLLHAQMMDWFDYSRVLPELSKSFHIFVVDYNGHGKTTSPDENMCANEIGKTLAMFIEKEISGKIYVSGNSSGGLLAVWLASRRPDLVRGLILEDPPLFASEYPRVKQTVAYKSFTTCHTYLNSQSNEDFLRYWIHSSAAFIAKNAGDKAQRRLLSMIEIDRRENPGSPVELPLLPVMLRMFFRGMSQFNPNFGDAFYTGKWNKGFDHSQALKNIQCPVLLLQANYQINEEGLLEGAMTKEDAQLAMSYLKNGSYKRIDADHVVHLDKPQKYVEITKQFFLTNTE
jgi:pimeloyl-ACP methyl ester carboxylesterase